MGIIYFVGCRDCHKVRDLGKFGAVALAPCQTRADAMAMSEDIEARAYQTALLVGFLAEHAGHNCTLFTENDGEAIRQCGAEIDDRDQQAGSEGRDYWHDGK